MTRPTAPAHVFTLNDIEIGLRVSEALAHHAHAVRGAPSPTPTC